LPISQMVFADIRNRNYHVYIFIHPSLAAALSISPINLSTGKLPNIHFLSNIEITTQPMLHTL